VFECIIIEEVDVTFPFASIRHISDTICNILRWSAKYVYNLLLFLMRLTHNIIIQ